MVGAESTRRHQQSESVPCPSTADCYAVGVTTVLASVNAGYTWQPDTIPAAVSGLNSISCPSTTDCTAVGFGIFGSPVIIGTSNGGVSSAIAKASLPARVSLPGSRADRIVVHRRQ